MSECLDSGLCNSEADLSSADEPLLPVVSKSEVVGEPPSNVKIPSYNNFVAYAVCINYVIGTGVFALPNAFYSAGIPLTMITLAFFLLSMIVGCWWVLEIMTRSHAFCQVKRGLNSSPIQVLGTEKYVYSRFCELFGGIWGKVFAEFCIICYCWGCLWSYVAVFSSSAATVIYQLFLPSESCDIYSDPDFYCNLAYYCCVAAYCLVVVPLACRDIAEQQIIQIILAFYRFFAFSVMLVTLAIALAVAGPVGDNGRDPWHFKWNGFGLMFTSSAVAMCVHYNLPDALAPVKDKRYLRWVVMGALSTAFGIYLVVGILASWFFNSTTEPLVTLNWKNFTGNAGGFGSGSIRWFAYPIQCIVLLFPPLDLLNVYPLVAITLGSNFLHLCPQNICARFGPKACKIFCRVLAALPPVALAAALGRIDVIFTYAGMFGFMLEFVIPCTWQLLSTSYFKKRWGKDSWKTPYSGLHSHLAVVWVVYVIGVASFGLALAVVIDPGLIQTLVQYYGSR